MLRFTEDMRIGHLVIDADHQRLIEIINQFAEASTVHTLFEGAAPSDCATVMHQTLKSLIAYTKEHFAKEEKIQRECMYQYHAMHVQEHHALVVQLEEIARTYFVRKSKPLNRKALEELREFMNFWLVNHVMKFDSNMREWVCPKE
ncbi:Bacteriohemerythrin [Magnetospirillum gryphiswaldense MSR-1 v2]|uniref:Bacteriohemerythrin n=2 Tax=Magnetospirillum gryphiswaldense TaxID=55518 RepID=V6F2U9_MAGGM|nr:Bacteriohemerythrin [Magnetospirillum gryphiswaldense MSR-1 v2]